MTSRSETFLHETFKPYSERSNHARGVRQFVDVVDAGRDCLTGFVAKKLAASLAASLMVLVALCLSVT